MERIAIVLWNGDIGGAEVLSLRLAVEFQALGVDPTIVFVADPDPLRKRLLSAGIPYRDLGFGRGRDIVLHPRRYARDVAAVGAEGALLLETGFMGAALRFGGYSEPIVAVEHGPVNVRPGYSKVRRALSGLDRRLGAHADDAEVGVSDYLVDQMRQQYHSKNLVRIYNGVDPDYYPPRPGHHISDGDEVKIGFMGRLVAGKGVDHLIRALALSRGRIRATLTIAGDGPERLTLEELAVRSGLDEVVTFVGVVHDLGDFWSGCDIAAIPTAELSEGFSLVTLEAMVCGKPIVAAASGAIPELILDGVTGTLVAPGDAQELVDALIAYAEDGALRDAHGAAARTRAAESFSLRESAIAYLDLFRALRNRRAIEASGHPA